MGSSALGAGRLVGNGEDVSVRGDAPVDDAGEILIRFSWEADSNVSGCGGGCTDVGTRLILIRGCEASEGDGIGVC